MNTLPNSALFEDSFSNAQQQFNNLIDTTDYSHLHRNPPINSPQLRDNALGHDLYEIPSASITNYLGYVVLLQNSNLRAFSPGVVTANIATPTFQVTMLNQPYDLRTGFTPGQHFGLSIKAQTRAAGFGNHGSKGGFEAGHFSAVLVGAQDSTIGESLARAGDRATHTVLQAGIPETMSRLRMLPIDYRTATVTKNQLESMKFMWHSGLVTESGNATTDYPNAVQLMMGAGIAVLGQRGIDRARQLVDTAIAGVRI